MLAWDNEWGYERTNMTVWANAPTIRRFQQSPTHQHLYFGFMREMMNKYFNVAYLLPRVQHYHKIVGGKYPDTLMDFIRDRTSYLNSVIPEAKAKVTEWKSEQCILQGTAPVETKMIKIILNDETILDCQPQWLSAIKWRLILPQTKKPSRIQFFDYDDNPIGIEQLLEQ